MSSQNPSSEIASSTPRSLPVVAIIGRPNVGKSTLFNRLTGRRTALVSDVPGLTRDRREGVAELWAHDVTLVDTAGLEEASKGSIAARMRAQSEAAIETADLVLFVIDARDGVIATDEVFAKIARASGRPTILVANKCEGRAGADRLYEAFSLGLGEPLAISAEHGEGMGDLISNMLGALGLSTDSNHENDDAGDLENARDARPVRVAVVGRPNAGKSTLVNALLGEDRMITGPEPGLTRDTIAVDVSLGGRAIRLFDTAGLRRKARISEYAEKLSVSDTIRAIRFAEVVVLMIDGERGIEKQDLTIADMVTQEGRALIVAINKWDIVSEKQSALKVIKEGLSLGLSQVPGVPIVPISALAETKLDKLVNAIGDIHTLWNKRVATPHLNRWLQDAVARHSPPAASGRRIKIRFITQPSARPPTFVAFCSKPESLPKSYVRYLTNSLRSAFDLPGVPIRLNLRRGENPFASDKRRR